MTRTEWQQSSIPPPRNCNATLRKSTKFEPTWMHCCKRSKKNMEFLKQGISAPISRRANKTRDGTKLCLRSDKRTMKRTPKSKIANLRAKCESNFRINAQDKVCC